MRKRLHIAATLLSLTLCVAVCVLWASQWSIFGGWSCRFAANEGLPRVEYAFGVDNAVWALRERYLLAAVPRPQVPPGRKETPETAKWDAEAGIGAYESMRVLGFKVESSPILKRDATGQRSMTSWRHSIRVPYPWLILIFALLPAHWTVTRLRRQKAFRRSHGLCLKCGYDLRASKERCPECGTAIPADFAAGGETKAV